MIEILAAYISYEYDCHMNNIGVHWTAASHEVWIYTCVVQISDHYECYKKIHTFPAEMYGLDMYIKHYEPRERGMNAYAYGDGSIYNVTMMLR